MTFRRVQVRHQMELLEDEPIFPRGNGPWRFVELREVTPSTTMAFSGVSSRQEY